MMNESQLPKVYDPKSSEEKWYQKWKEGGYFKPRQGKMNQSYCLIMPPPNVTGKLHMGHALDHTLQDIIIRQKRMEGYETLWIPGQDHAGIATQAKVEQLLYEEEKKTKHDLGREEFLKKTWEWKNKYGPEIIKQIEKIGDSCDWDYFTFTLDDIPQEAVKKFFCDLYNEGLIYQSDYIVNWDPILQSAISDAEVDHEEVQGYFYHIKYQIAGKKDFLEVATTRPETLFGDTAVCVNPHDDRYEDLIGKTVILPLTNKEIPIIADEYVDMDTGTGCLKVTPGHDFNDYELGKKHQLPLINLLNPDGRFNDQSPLIGLTVKEGRKKTISMLEEAGLLVKKVEHKHKVGHSQRSGEVVEPLVSKQWFLNTDQMAAHSVDLVEKEKMKFFPKQWENTYFSYQRNPRNWCISRQLWWGHQIPVYYCENQNCLHVFASVNTPEKCPKCGETHFHQDPDVLDTWFSSGLFPLSTLGWPNKEVMIKKGFDRFYPTATLVTGFDIIFFWVARMMMMCHKATGLTPFSDVYIHAIVRDKNGVKMSKSLGNVIDPLEMIERFGCDALRFTLAISSGYNRNINLDPEKIEVYRNFINKIWNAFRFIEPYLAYSHPFELSNATQLHPHEKWILSELNTVIKNMSQSLNEYRFDDACQEVYHFIYEKLCSWFIEVSKGILQSENATLRSQRATVLKYVFAEIVKLLHPICPFITEELWTSLKNPHQDLLICESFPEYKNELSFPSDVAHMNKFMELITLIRNLRSSVNLKPKDPIHLHLFTDDAAVAKYLYQSRLFLKDLVAVEKGNIKSKSQEKPKKSLSMATNWCEVYIPLEGVLDLQEHIEKLQREINKLVQEHDKILKKLSNPQFMQNAASHAIDEVKQKDADFKEKKSSLEKILAQFK